jgi:hypothetical protein
VLHVFVQHYNRHRPHRALNLAPPDQERPTLTVAGSSSRNHPPRSPRRPHPRIQPRGLKPI